MTTDIRLSDTQRVILAAACGRDGRRVFPITATKLTGGAVGNVLRSLITRGLTEAVPAEADDTIWAHDDAATPLTLRATALALDALGIEPEPGEAEKADEPAAADGAEVAEDVADPVPDEDVPPEAPAAPRVRKARADSKQARLIAMLQRPEGASIPEIADALDWQPHTVRGAIAGALKRKLGLDVTSGKEGERGRVYRLATEG